MSGLDKDRFRNQTISFRVSTEERLQLEARIKVSGMPKGQYFIKSLLHQELTIAVGKYQSDRLSLELKRLREGIMMLDDKGDIISECKALLEQLIKITDNPVEQERLESIRRNTE